MLDCELSAVLSHITKIAFCRIKKASGVFRLFPEVDPKASGDGEHKRILATVSQQYAVFRRNGPDQFRLHIKAEAPGGIELDATCPHH